MKKTVMATLLSSSLACSVFANERAEAPEPPQIPPKVESGEVLEPDITIIESEKGVIEEYSVNGRVYMVKITPTSGAPYYLLDNDGDGNMDVREEAHPGNVAIPQWVLFSW